MLAVTTPLDPACHSCSPGAVLTSAHHLFRHSLHAFTLLAANCLCTCSTHPHSPGAVLTSAYQLFRQPVPDPEWAAVVPHFRWAA